MLILDGLEKVDNKGVKEVLTEFRKSQVSRYPVNLAVPSNSYMVGLVDSRFPTDRYGAKNMVACIWWEQQSFNGTEPTWKYTLESRLINNEKFSRHNSDYHTRSTNDPKKLLKFLKEYAKPFSSHEVAYKTFRDASSAFDNWQSGLYSKARKSCANFDFEDMMTELMHIKQYGLSEPTEGMRKMMESIPAWEEYKEAKAKKFSRIHVFINPDDIVTITNLSNAKNLDLQTYEDMTKTPQYIQEQVGMLRLVDGAKYIPSVGYKASDREFWVEGLSQ